MLSVDTGDVIEGCVECAGAPEPVVGEDPVSFCGLLVIGSIRAATRSTI
jgi:hypothetical protein